MSGAVPPIGTRTDIAFTGRARCRLLPIRTALTERGDAELTDDEFLGRHQHQQAPDAVAPLTSAELRSWNPTIMMVFPLEICENRRMSSSEVARQASVLLEFRAENVRSFKHPFALSLLATGVSETDYVRSVAWRAGGSPISVLPVSAVFGANGSGKSNVLKAMGDMRRQVLHSFRHGEPGGGLPRRPFLLDADGPASPTRFEVDLVLEGVRHEYGFVFTDEAVIEEWAYRYPKGRAALLFHRRGLDVEIGPDDRAKSRAVIELLRDNALYLSTAASANHQVLLPLFRWFNRNLILAEADTRPYRQAMTTEMLNDDKHREQVLTLLQAADLGVTNAKKRELDPVMQERVRRALRILNGTEDDTDTEEGPTFEQLGVTLTHRGADGDVDLDAHDESLGTRVWFGLIGLVVRALDDGSVFLADELDSSLHPALVAEMVRLFQSPITNPRRAQLVFNSHDASLLGDAVSDRLLGRDQIWFTEKRHDGSTRLYPLVDLEPRKQEAISKRYLAGRYGGTPIVSSGEFAAAAALITAGHG
jgi:uncharacterized protein